MTFTVPTSTDSLNALQSDTTELLRAHQAAFLARKLERKGLKPSDYQTDAERLKAIGPAISEATRKEYQKRGTQLLQDAHAAKVDVWEMAVARATTKGGWYQSRAALQYVLVSGLRRAKAKVDEYRRLPLGSTPEQKEKNFFTPLRSIVIHANALAAMPSEEYGKWAAAVDSKKVKGSSKKSSLRGLPDDWQMLLARTMPETCALSWLTQSLTGCRSAELEKGVSLTLSADRKTIRALVKGAKVTEHAGQPLRELVVDTSSGLAAALAAVLEPNVVLNVGTGRSREAYRKMVSRYGDALFPGRGKWTSVTTYSARNQVKSDLKAAGVSALQVAAAMGHSSTGSSKNYGGSKRAGVVAPVRVRASRPVKTRVGYRPKTTASPSTNLVVPSRTKRPKNGP
jgi:hypothetical protein